MDIMEAMEKRHAVRSFEREPLAADAVEELSREVERVNAESGLHIQLITDSPGAFST
jgi:hypothetical protein